MTKASRIVAWSRRGGVARRRLVQALCVFLFSFDLPPEVEVGKNVEFLHNGIGTVIHPKTLIGDDVMIAQNVTIGNANMYRGYAGRGRFRGVQIGEGASICAGAKVLCSDGVLRVGKGTVVGANAVLLNSTGDNEVWAGVPACLIKRSNSKS